MWLRNLNIITNSAEDKVQGLFEVEIQYKHHRGGCCLAVNNSLLFCKHISQNELATFQFE